MTKILIQTFLFLTIAQRSLASAIAGSGLSAAPPGRPPLGDQLYYKSGEGVLHGPFRRDQVLTWWQQGYFPQGIKN